MIETKSFPVRESPLSRRWREDLLDRGFPAEAELICGELALPVGHRGAPVETFVNDEGKRRSYGGGRATLFERYLVLEGGFALQADILDEAGWPLGVGPREVVGALAWGIEHREDLPQVEEVLSTWGAGLLLRALLDWRGAAVAVTEHTIAFRPAEDGSFRLHSPWVGGETSHEEFDEIFSLAERALFPWGKTLRDLFEVIRSEKVNSAREFLRAEFGSEVEELSSEEVLDLAESYRRTE